MVKEVRSLCHQSNLGGHRGLEGSNKILNGFFLLSARQNGRCDTCLTKERSMPARTRVNMPSLARYVGEKLYVELVTMSETIRGNCLLMSAEYSFSRYCQAYPIPNKETHTVAKVLMDYHFNIYGLPDQLHSDNKREFVYNLWRELFSEFKNVSMNLGTWSTRSLGPVVECVRVCI